MIAVNCPSCQRVTGHKRALGWGTFFAVLLTGGIWFLALPFYKQRCLICGTLPSERLRRALSDGDKLRAGRYSAGITLAVMGALVAGIVLLFWLAPK